MTTKQRIATEGDIIKELRHATRNQPLPIQRWELPAAQDEVDDAQLEAFQ